MVSLDLIVFSSRKVIDEAKKQWGVDHVILVRPTRIRRCRLAGCSFGRPPIRLDSQRPGASRHDRLARPVGRPVVRRDRRESDRGDRPSDERPVPARLAVGKGPFESAYMAHNRRLVRDGRVTAFGRSDRRPTWPIDPTVGMLRIDDLAGRTSAPSSQSPLACPPR